MKSELVEAQGRPQPGGTSVFWMSFDGSLSCLSRGLPRLEPRAQEVCAALVSELMAVGVDGR